jgi:hypothetical protein
MMRRIPVPVDGKITLSKDDALLIADMLSYYEDILETIPLSREMKRQKEKAGWYHHAFTCAFFRNEEL